MSSTTSTAPLRRWLAVGVIIVETFLVCACASLGPAYTPGPASPADKATVYVYRRFNVLGGGLSPTVFVNGVPFAQLPAGGYFMYQGEPGQVKLSDKSKATPSAVVEAKAGEVYYVKGTMVPLVGHLDLTLVSRQTGEKEITSCKLVPESMAANAQTRADFHEVTVPSDEGTVVTYPGVAWFSGADALAGFGAYLEAEHQAIAGTLELTDQSLTFLSGGQPADRTGTGLRIAYADIASVDVRHLLNTPAVVIRRRDAKIDSFQVRGAVFIKRKETEALGHLLQSKIHGP